MHLKFPFKIRMNMHAALAALFLVSALAIGALSWRIAVVETVPLGGPALRQEQQLLLARIAALETGSQEEQRSVEERMRWLMERQRMMDDQERAGVDAPFRIEDVVPAIVEITCIDNAGQNTYYTGSGTVIDPEGFIVTNRHTLLSDDGSLIKFCGVGVSADPSIPPRVEFVAAAVAIQQENDLALLRISERLDGAELPKAFSWISLSGSAEASRELRLGDEIFIGGYPGIGSETFTFTQGVVSGRVGERLIKTSALIDSGTSGGAAFDARGRYVGLPSAAARGEIGGSLGYLVGADAVDAFVREAMGD